MLRAIFFVGLTWSDSQDGIRQWQVTGWHCIHGHLIWLSNEVNQQKILHAACWHLRFVSDVCSASKQHIKWSLSSSAWIPTDIFDTHGIGDML